MASSNHLAPTPPMGWNSWNTFGNDINESVVRETAEALISTGLKDHGYHYIVIDDCWSIKERRDGNGVSFVEYQTHMSVWVTACSPLMIGCDVRKMDSDTASLLMNREVLDVNQDSLGIPAKRVKRIGSCDIWTKRLADKSVAVSVINRGSQLEEITVQARDIGLLDSPKLARNLWTGQDIADFKVDLPLKIAAHQTILLKVTP